MSAQRRKDSKGRVLQTGEIALLVDMSINGEINAESVIQFLRRR